VFERHGVSKRAVPQFLARLMSGKKRDQAMEIGIEGYPKGVSISPSRP